MKQLNLQGYVYSKVSFIPKNRMPQNEKMSKNFKNTLGTPPPISIRHILIGLHLSLFWYSTCVGLRQQALVNFIWKRRVDWLPALSTVCRWHSALQVIATSTKMKSEIRKLCPFFAVV